MAGKVSEALAVPGGASLGQDWSRGTARALGVTVRSPERLIRQVSGVLGGWLDRSFVVRVAALAL